MKRAILFSGIFLVSVAFYKGTYSATFKENVHYTFQRVVMKLKDYFHQVFGFVPSSSPFQPEEPIEPENVPLSPFQQLFRSTITITNQASNILTNTANSVIAHAQKAHLSSAQVADQFIHDLQAIHHAFMTQALKETLDIDFTLVTSSFNAIHTYGTRLQKAIAPLEKVRLKNQLMVLTDYLAHIQKNIGDLKQAGIVKVSAALAAQALTGYEQKLVTQFKEVYTAYPTIIEHINNFKIAGPGKIMQSVFNRASELIEQIIVLHQSAGKIGTILVQKELIEPLNTIKDNLRKLGNAIDFTTTTKPLIVTSPPTTYEALVTILRNFTFEEGFQIKDLVMQDITTLTNLSETLHHKIHLLIPAVATLRASGETIIQRIQEQFMGTIKAAPARTIPRAPFLLREIVEAQVTAIKQQLNTILHYSALSINNLSEMLATTAHFLPYINQCMGATIETPFVNPTIIRGLDFIAEDTQHVSSTIEKINEGIENYSLGV